MRVAALILASSAVYAFASSVVAGDEPGSPAAGLAGPARGRVNAFRQLDDKLPAPSTRRLASGAPGPGYWQQRADYRIRAVIDERTDTLEGTATITYTNNSPHALEYLWVHLDQNRFAPDSASSRSGVHTDIDEISLSEARALLSQARFGGGMTLTAVHDAAANDLPHTVVGTQMRVDLRQPLAAGARTTLTIGWTMPVTPIPAVDDRA